MCLGFLNPAFLWALPLVAIPIVIHLLNRRRYRRIRWAAMEYLLIALRRNRRRLQMEQWLVLLLRIAAVAALILLVSRPELAGSWLGQLPAHHVVCLDDSASMRQQLGVGEAFDTARERAQAAVERLCQQRPGDLLTILRGSRAAEPDLLALRTSASAAARVRELLRPMTPTDSVADLAGLLEAARRQLAATPQVARGEITLVTDFRQVDWLQPDGKPRPELVQQLAALDPDQHRLHIVVVESASSANLAIVDIRTKSQIPLAAAPVAIAVEVENQGENQSGPAELTIEIEGKGRRTQPVGPLDPGASEILTFWTTIAAPGFAGLTASLPRDRFASDDRRSLAIEVVAASRVLLVDGDPGDQPRAAETYLLAAALATQPGLRLEIVHDQALEAHELHDLDLVWLCNAAAPSPQVVEKLESFVAAGGGLVVTAGERVDPADWNARLWRGGLGVLPAPWTEPAGDLDRPLHVVIADRGHAIVGTATAELEAALGRLTLVGRWLGVGDTRSASTILRLRDSAGPPLLLARSFGSGTVLQITTTVDDAWTNWPRVFPFLVLVHEMHHAAAKAHDQAAFNLLAQDTLRVPIDLNVYGPDVVLRGPAPDGNDTTFTAPEVHDGSLAVVTAPLQPLQGLGLFELWLAHHTSGQERRLVARNLAPVEGQLQPLTTAQFEQAIPEPARRCIAVARSQPLADNAAKTQDLWRIIAWVLLGLLLSESALAWRLRSY